MDLSKAQIDEFKDMLSGHVSDAMEFLGLPRTVAHGYKLIGAGNTVVVGPAFTVQQVPKHASYAHDEPAVRHKEVSGELAGEGKVIIIDIGGRTDVCSWGEFHSFSCMTRGVAGTIVNGSTRDSNAIRELGYPVFCRGFSPIKSRWNLETVGIEVPVNIGDVQVRPNDLVFADETGIVIVPKEHISAVLERAKEIRDWENDEMARLRKQFPQIGKARH